MRHAATRRIVTEITIDTPARIRAAGTLAGGLLLCFAAPFAQAQLPQPSRTVYKCESKGKITYTDEPCLGARRLDVVPTRGVDKLSGTERTGTDVANERRREVFADALRPISGMNAEQLATFSRRQRLDSRSQRECAQLEAAILDTEQAERRNTGAGVIESLRQDLHILRKRYRQLGC